MLQGKFLLGFSTDVDIAHSEMAVWKHFISWYTKAEAGFAREELKHLKIKRHLKNAS